MSSTYSVRSLYQSVIEDVIEGTREAFLNEGIDDAVRLELQALWETKLTETGACPPEASSSSKAGNSVNSNGERYQGNRHVLPVDLNHLVTITITMPIDENHPENQNTTEIQVPASVILTTNLAFPLPNVVPSVAKCDYSWPYSTCLSMARCSWLLTTILQEVLSQPAILKTMALPFTQAGTTAMLQKQVNKALIEAGVRLGKSATKKANALKLLEETGEVPQADGEGDSSSGGQSEEEEDYGDDHRLVIVEDSDGESKEDEDSKEVDHEEVQAPLNSDDDLPEAEEPDNPCDNVIICQYEKMTRSRTKWKFVFKDGIMHFRGKDYVFQKAVGDAEW